MSLDFTDLILLIGTNPLPNYVAAKYFIGENSNLDRIWMVCSEKSCNQESTKDYAESLQNLLKNDKFEFPELIFIKDIGSKSSIESGLEKIIKQTDSNEVHLSFTGGTKAMAAYSYSYLKDKKGVDFSASYLSARSFNIKFDDGIISDNLRGSIKITFDDLRKLHLFEKGEKKVDKYGRLGSVTNKFQEIIEQNKMSNFYLNKGSFQRDIFKIDDRNKDLEKIFKNLPNPESDMQKAVENKKFFETKLDGLKPEEKENFKRRVEILKKILEYKPNDEFRGIINAFPKEYKLYENRKFNTNIERQNYNTAVEFMDGFWFEQYVGKLVENNLKDKFDEMLFNQKPYKVDDKEKNNFEIDIVLMKGYQLIGISCTTDSKKKLCKFKGFEIILRTRQIGGEEAKAILITHANDKTVIDLQSELILSTGTTKKNILVLGADDWRENELMKKIGKFISLD